MDKLIWNTITVWLMLLFASGCEAQDRSFVTVQPESVGLSSDSLAAMDRYFHELVDDGRLAGIQTAVLKNGKLAHFDSYGYANIAEAIPLNSQTIFRIFSMTKPIVSVALMQLYDQGLFQLEDPISLYLPEFKTPEIYTDTGMVAANRPIRVIDLLRHTSGYGYGRSAYPALNQMYASANLYAARDNREYVSRVSKLPLQFEPGTNWQYGVSTNIVGRLVEVLSGQPLNEYLKVHILDPLSMHDTHFQLPADKIERFTVGYGWQEDVGLTVRQAQRSNRYVQEVTLFNGGGGLVSTANDYIRFCQMMLQKGKSNGQTILSEASVNLMLQDHLQEARARQQQLRLPDREVGFGLGFAVRGSETGEMENVFGWGGAVGTYFKIDTENDLAYVMMIQLSPHRHLGLRALLQDFVESALIE